MTAFASATRRVSLAVSAGSLKLLRATDRSVDVRW
jgi:hypothetical protein